VSCARQRAAVGEQKGWDGRANWSEAARNAGGVADGAAINTNVMPNT
jgi:hypothetical protein